MYISHAPQAPYFGPINSTSGGLYWTGTNGGYSAVYQACPDIDLFSVQFYKQGNHNTAYESLFVTSVGPGTDYPGTAVNDTSSYGIPFEKIVVGKRMREIIDGDPPFVSAFDLNGLSKKAQHANLSQPSNVML